MLYNILLIVQIVVSVGIIVLVLMQQGKGADAGAAFGSGASGTVFGARGAANFLSRTTAILATVFFLNSGALAYLASGRSSLTGSSIMDTVTETHTGGQPEDKPAVTPSNGDVPPVPGADASQTSDVPPAPVTDKAEDSTVVNAASGTPKDGAAADGKTVQDKQN